MHFPTHTLLDDGVVERAFTLDDFTCMLWTPRTATPSSPVPLLLLNQPGGFGARRVYPRLLARAKAAAADGFASVMIELPGTGHRCPASSKLAPTCAPRSPRVKGRAPT